MKPPRSKLRGGFISKFCQDCGKPLRASNSKISTERKTIDPIPDVSVIFENPPKDGITIEFPHSSAQSFDFSLLEAQKFPSYKKYGNEKKAIYRITVNQKDLDSVSELLEHLKGWRKRIVYINGEKVPWETVFSYSWCLDKKKASFKPEYYCFGFENEYQLNTWGCIQANLPFIENADWFCWGSWLNNKGDWKFDKDRIRFELQKMLFKFKFCPALNPELIQDVLSALPDIVNPIKDKNWKFVERWGDETSPGIIISVTRYGIKENVVMKGVCPNGQGALHELKKRMKFKLPVGK